MREPKNRVNREASEINKLFLLGSSICLYSSYYIPRSSILINKPLYWMVLGFGQRWLGAEVFEMVLSRGKKMVSGLGF